jgi:hypothetical protein
MYKQILTPDGDLDTNVIVRTTDGAYIFFNPQNIDYQHYLKWLAEGNTPEPADE